MAARGTKEKEIITKKIFEMFPDAFMDGKIIRIPMIDEENQPIQIKLSLTAAKDIVGQEQPKVTTTSNAAVHDWSDDAMNKPEDLQITHTEAKKISAVMEKLGL